MRPVTIILSLSLLASLAACGKEKCTKDVLDRKSTELMEKVQTVGRQNPLKIVSLGPKVAEVIDRANTGVAKDGDDMEPICTAIDDLSAELDKE